MGGFQRGRHVPAFLLIILADGPAYGLELMQKLDELVPGNRADTAILYRSLKKLQEEGLVTLRLDDTAGGPVRKYYTITQAGYDELDVMAEDIRLRIRNLSTFIDRYEAMKSSGGHQAE